MLFFTKMHGDTYFIPVVTSIITSFICIIYSKRKGIFLDPANQPKPQRMHIKDTPRCGGVGIFIALCIGSLITDSRLSILIIITSLPAFLIGTLEDITGNIKPWVRLLFASISALAGILIVGATVTNIGYFKLWLTFPAFVSIPFTIFAVTGVTNSINIIDGINGLASGFTIISLLSLAYVSYKAGNPELTKAMLLTLLATTGFFMLNFPWGKIFLGDGGAYLLGFLLAEFSVLLVVKNSSVSPWFPLAILIYPVWESLFSIYRRKMVKHKRATAPDKLHLHSVLKRVFIKSNPLTSVALLLFISVFDYFATKVYSRTQDLTILAFTFIILYTIIYDYTLRTGKNRKKH